MIKKSLHLLNVGDHVPGLVLQAPRKDDPGLDLKEENRDPPEDPDQSLLEDDPDRIESDQDPLEEDRGQDLTEDDPDQDPSGADQDLLG